MLRRLFVGLCIGLVIGGGLAAGLVGLQWPTFVLGGGVWMAYLTAGLVGALTGLVAGKPIWSSGAAIEAGLKAVFGVLLGAGAMFALRQWGAAWSFDLSRVAAGAEGPIGQLPVVSLPLIGAVLGMLFELDNTAAPDGRGARATEPSARKRIASPPRRGGAGVGAPPATAARAGAPEDPDETGADAVEVGSRRAKR